MANIGRLDKIIDLITAEEIKHDQGTWTSGLNGEVKHGEEGQIDDELKCGTACCIAGWAAVMYAPKGTKFTDYDDVTLPDGIRVSYPSYGRQVLDLTWDEADVLFNGDNDLDEIQEMRNALEDGSFHSRYLGYEDGNEECECCR
ncbi:hypothetical protein E1264_03390 [Actinomadura sp. KC216]|uniref:hypothetical protein n=1 Tax=Actinomadura sp. KC216 TaxID=2530370 RepID=UPI0010501D5A|nr:hypothetical protein [Actinomadura sp. KC216]TDB90883.1 hypothetical protein E1264_03390 [Actinomadura sp. KC216]